ncbi:hypothetical protein [Stenotrophomonas maltophilia]|uniref:hypothetical protein n=1 Tax=Stenotrophomonas maltophilia TaxID=40324 RepID=UPI003BF836EE
MSNDKTTLADVQPGGGVRLGDQAERAQFEVWVKNHVSSLARAADGDYASNFTHALWSAWQAALSAQPSPAAQAAHCPVTHCGMTYARVPADGRCHACGATVQPSPGGQGDSRSEKAAAFLRQYLTYLRSSPRQGLRPRWCDVYEALEVAIEALAARQPSKQPDSVALGEATEFCSEKGAMQPMGEPVAYTSETQLKAVRLCGDGIMSQRNAKWDIPLYLRPAQAMDLPYSLDADPAGIRARVCDVITGTLMVGAQGHTPPPAGHWAEPFWKAARADATAQAVDLGQQQDAARWRAIAPHLSVEWDEDEMLKRWTWIDFRGDALSVPTRSRESYASVEEAIDAVIATQAVGNG